MRTWKACVLAIVIAIGLTTRAGVAQVAVRPNVVVFMIDDFDLESLRMLRDKGKLPFLSRYFYDVGHEFVESFSVASLGGPSRATFLTGQYPHNHGVRTHYPPLGGDTRLNASSTVATWLSRAGYRTAFVGRYVTGYGLTSDGSIIPPGWNDWNGLLDPSFGTNMVDYKVNINGVVVDFGALSRTLGTELYQTDMLTLLTLQTIQRAGADRRPFFLSVNPVSFNFELPPYNACPDPSDPSGFGGSVLGLAQRPAPRHLNTIFGNEVDFPLPMPPSFNEDDVSDKPTWVQANPPFTAEEIDCVKNRHWRKLETLLAVDQLVGAVMTELETRGLLANTYAIFTADNGLLDGQHRFALKTPAYEDTIRVPLVIRTPANTVPRQIDKLVLNTDLAPTIAHLAQATPTHAVDGRSLVPLLQGVSVPLWRTIGLIAHLGAEPNTFGRMTGPPDYFAVRTAIPTPRKYVRYPTVTTGVAGEYYDLVTDPFELDNLYLDPSRQAEVQRLDAWQNALKTCRGVGCWVLETFFTWTN